ncbi:hypothetical protein SUGI_0137710 [Cryptomeria japonica]|nr:hypothetical protein SUGI_0137710 [Cryptomeria japonica]
MKPPYGKHEIQRFNSSKSIGCLPSSFEAAQLSQKQGFLICTLGHAVKSDVDAMERRKFSSGAFFVLFCCSSFVKSSRKRRGRREGGFGKFEDLLRSDC